MVLLVMGLLLLPMLQMTSITAKGQAASSGMRTAVKIGQSAIDSFRKTPWDSIRSSPAEGFEGGADGKVVPAFSMLSKAAGDSVSVRGTVYYRLWRVVPDPEIPNLKTITVWCCWKGKENTWRHTMLVTQVTDVDDVRK